MVPNVVNTSTAQSECDHDSEKCTAVNQDTEASPCARGSERPLLQMQCFKESKLDKAMEELDCQLLPLRRKLGEEIYQRMEAYDKDTLYPREMDRFYENRNGYELHLRSEAYKKLRKKVKEYYAKGRTFPCWKVVGGFEKGGIIVREGVDLTSSQLSDRLSTGAVVEELQIEGDRMQYRMLSGSGPSNGWISMKLKGQGGPERKLVVATSRAPTQLPTSSTLVVIVALMAVHISTNSRIRRFRFALQSIEQQALDVPGVDFLISISWSAATEELSEQVDTTIRDFSARFQDSIAVRQTEKHSQFEHLCQALTMAELELHQRFFHQDADSTGPSVWVVFGDDDDVWHRNRISQYARQIKSHPMLDAVAMFVTDSRAICKEHREIGEWEMPTTEAEVDDFLTRRHAKRLDREDVCRTWHSKLRAAGPNSDLVPVADEIPFEYFDMCPRLRIMHEFLDRTSPEVLGHRYCDLRFREFLLTYPRMGLEMGLELCWFPAECWMYFYACTQLDSRQWAKSIEEGNGEEAGLSSSMGLQGHMSSELRVENSETALAAKHVEEFKKYDSNVTVSKIARYWAAFRNSMELFFVPWHRGILDQRTFDAWIFYSVCGAFCKFAEKVSRQPKNQQERGLKMMCKYAQDYAKQVADRFEVTVFWHKPDGFIDPPAPVPHGGGHTYYEPQYVHDSVSYKPLHTSWLQK